MTTTTAEQRDFQPSPDAVSRPASNGFRTDVQALRAIAVLAVVVNHLWPTRLTGGYVGVDVFFVISGFLITSHLDREITKTARIRLARFYARRVRRLLPAAFLVLGFCVVAAYFLLPFPRWAATTQESLASALYWENWLLAAHSVEYSNLGAAASVVQHYWSLSVEEQFYLFWPLILLLLFKIRLKQAKIIGLAVIGAASLAFSIYFTEISKSQAYFVTPGRVWEFAIGALIALGGVKLVLPRVLANLAALAGLVMIIGSAVMFDHNTNFPGAIALIPTIGTGLVILSGTDSAARQWHTPLSASRPVQFIGNISYSLYLWHWPLIVLAPFALRDALVDGRLTSSLKVGVLVASILLAALSKWLIEDRFRTWKTIARSTKLTFAGMVAGMAAVAVAASVLTWTYDRHVAQAERDMLASGACHGAAAMTPGSTCPDPFGPANQVNMGPANEYWKTPKECIPLAEYRFDENPTTYHCDFSMGAPARKMVWLVGDSHALQWIAPLIDMARERHWFFKLSVQGGCPFAKIQYRGYGSTWPDVLTNRCMNWTPGIADMIAKDKPDIVFTSFFARLEYAEDHSGRSQTEQYRDGVKPYWQKWINAGARVVVLVDPPLNVEVRAPDCVVLNPDKPTACAVDRSLAQPLDPLTEVVRGYNDPNVSYVDLTDYFCDQRKCYAVIGNVAVYFDINHMNVEFSRSLQPMITKTLGLGQP